MFDQYSQAIQGQGTGAPTSPLGDFPELRGMMDVRFQNASKAGSMQALGSQRTIEEENRRRAEAAAKQAQMQELQDKLETEKSMQDPKNYQKVAKDDGGFDFYNPKGERISVSEYARVTKAPPSKVLADSENNLDRQYIQDHKNLNELLNTISSGDTKKMQKLYDDNPGLKESISGLKPDDLVKQFRQAYPNIYGENGEGAMNNVFASPTGRVRNINEQLFSGGGSQSSGGGWFDALKSIFSNLTRK